MLRFKFKRENLNWIQIEAQKTKTKKGEKTALAHSPNPLFTIIL